MDKVKTTKASTPVPTASSNEPIPADQALYSYLEDQPSLAYPWPKVKFAKQLSIVPRNHPVVGLMAAVDKGNTSTNVTYRRRYHHSPLAKQLCQAIIAHTLPAERIGFDYFCLLPPGHHPDHLACHPLLLVRIKPDSPLTRDWHRASTAAQACRRVLESFNLNDIHCLLVESADALRGGGGGGSADETDSNANAPNSVYYHLGENDYDEVWLPQRQMLSLTGQPGSPIAPVAQPDTSGTVALTILLEVDIQPQGGKVDTENNSSPITPPTAIATLLLTCRHVVDDSDKTSSSRDIDRLVDVIRCSFSFGPNSGSDSASEAINVIQLSQRQFDSLLESARTKKDENCEDLKAFQDNKDEVRLADNERSRRDKLEHDCIALENFIAHLEKLKHPQSRCIGTVVLSPPLTGPNADGDWALILSCVCSSDPAGCDDVVHLSYANTNSGTEPNLFWIKELDGSVRSRLRQSVPQSIRTITGTAHSRLSSRDFVELKTYFTQDTIDQHCYSAIDTDHQRFSRYTPKELSTHLGSPDSMDVYHVGAEGARHGKFSHVKSYTFTGSNAQDMAYDYCILGHNNKPFSQDGDSGAAIFGILPPPSSADFSTIAEADIDKDTQVGVLGLIRAGTNLRGRHIISDVTYAIPIETVMEKPGVGSVRGGGGGGTADHIDALRLRPTWALRELDPDRSGSGVYVLADQERPRYTDDSGD
ncbi:hypothetical protein diail_9638, partial [Diaporthe ilicicola]